MATILEIQKAIKTLIGANLRNAPDKAALSDTVETFIRLLKDVPGEALILAVDDHILTTNFWPSVKQIREAAYQVQIHNYKSAAPNPWKEETRTERRYPWCARVGSDGHWYSMTIDSSQPVEKYPDDPEFARKEALVEVIDKRTNGNWTEEDYRLVDEILGPPKQRIEITGGAIVEV